MSKERTSFEKVCLSLDGEAPTDGTNKIASEVDVGTSQNAEAFLVLELAAASDLDNVDFWTSQTSDFLTAGAAGGSNANATQIKVTSDAIQAYDVYDGSISDLTVSSNTISTIDQPGVYRIALPDVKRYVNMQYDGNVGSGTSRYSLVIVGYDQQDSPSTEQTAY